MVSIIPAPSDSAVVPTGETEVVVCFGEVFFLRVRDRGVGRGRVRVGLLFGFDLGFDLGFVFGFDLGFDLGAGR